MSTKWCRYLADAKESYGRVEGENVVAVDGVPWAEPRETGARYTLTSVKLLPPVIPPTFYCVGLNYSEHLLASAKRRGVEPKLPARPDVNYRAVNALCASGDAIVKPRDAGELFQ